jgi:pimeloyl-ACP methyl ester carboxylesterase
MRAAVAEPEQCRGIGFITPDVMPAGLRMPAGYPLPGYRLAIIDDGGEPVPPGTVGELIVSSSFTALGEWQHGRCIPGRLQPDPEDPSCRILHTGDLARLRSDGLFVLVGRRDRQIKIGGGRVEPAEIENTLRHSPHVSEAVVLAQREGADIRLIAFVVPARGSNARLADDLREMLHSTIPAHMQPANIVLVDTIPLLPGGKVDGQAMLAGAAAAATRATAAAGCFAETHASGRSRAIVARAWYHVLNRTSYDQDLRFDEADGDSLRLLQLVFRLEQLCGTALPLDAFQGDLRPSGFARSLDRILSGEPAASSRLRAVVLLPGMGNDEPRLARFRAACAHELTIVPIDYGDWSEWVAPGSDFSTLAASVVARIQTNIPSGPVTLAGYSMGGRVAYNAAQMLISAGRSIGLVAILDADALPLDESQEAHVPMSRPQELREFVTSWKTGQAADAAARIIVRRLSSPRWASILRLAAGLRKARWLGDAGFF